MSNNNANTAKKEHKAKTPVPYIRARIDNLVDNPDSKLKAFASISICGHFAIHGIKVFDNGETLSIAFPTAKNERDGKYYEQAHSISSEAHQAVKRYVIEAYEYKLEQAQKRAQSTTGTADDESAQAERDGIDESDNRLDGPTI